MGPKDIALHKRIDIMETFQGKTWWRVDVVKFDFVLVIAAISRGQMTRCRLWYWLTYTCIHGGRPTWFNASWSSSSHIGSV